MLSTLETEGKTGRRMRQIHRLLLSTDGPVSGTLFEEHTSLSFKSGRKPLACKRTRARNVRI